ncbi:MAG: hypothetical protein AAFX93_13025 [Verrucomicrobiota bacterium]
MSPLRSLASWAVVLCAVVQAFAQIPQSNFRSSDRLAISSDGNPRVDILVPNRVIHPQGGFRAVGDSFTLDPDDIPAMPLSLAIIANADLQSKLVHYHYNCGFVPENIAARNFPNRMKIAIDENTPLTLGSQANSMVFDSWDVPQATINHLADQINQSTADSHLYIMLAGPADIVYQAIAAAQQSKRQYIHIVSHSGWNESTKFLTEQHTLSDIKQDFPAVNNIRIGNQNVQLNTIGNATWAQRGDRNNAIFNAWRWMDQPSENGLSGLTLALDRIFESMVQYRVPDVSDAGMIWWTLKLDPTSAAADGSNSSYVTPAQLETFFARGGSDATQESVDCSQLPSSVSSKTAYTVTLGYTANQPRDLVVAFYDNGTWIAAGRTTVSSGTGTTDVTINLPSAPAVGSGYEWRSAIREVGQGWQTNKDTCSEVFTVAGGTTPGSDTVSCAELPVAVASQTNYAVSVPYTATESRDIVVEFWDSSWLSQGKTTVSAGSGTATVNITLPSAPPEGSNYLFKVGIRPLGGDWQSRFDFCQEPFSVSGSSSTPQASSFGPIDDAYLQGSTAFNNNLLKVEANNRTSYLKFNVTGVGNVTSATLTLTVAGDAGNGTIRVHQGASNSWTQANLSTGNAPGKGVLLGTVTGSFGLGAPVDIDLGSSIDNGVSSLVVSMDGGGNDAWFSSLEGVTTPQLTISHLP